MAEAADGLIDQGRLLVRQVLAAAHTRAQLLGLEAREELDVHLAQLRWLLAGAVAALLAAVTLIVIAAIALPADARLPVLVALVVVFAAVALYGVLRARRRRTTPLFARLARQLELDRAALGGNDEPEKNEEAAHGNELGSDRQEHARPAA